MLIILQKAFVCLTILILFVSISFPSYCGLQSTQDQSSSVSVWPAASSSKVVYHPKLCNHHQHAPCSKPWLCFSVCHEPGLKKNSLILNYILSFPLSSSPNQVPKPLQLVCAQRRDVNSYVREKRTPK
jgi:hypothetical protein